MQHTAANYYISKFYHHAIKCGLDADNLLAKAEIPKEIIDVPDQRIEIEKLAMVVQGIWDLLNDEAISLSQSPIPRGSFYMMGKLTIHEPNLGKALMQIKRFYGFVTKAFTMDIQTVGKKVIVTCEMHFPDKDPDHLFAEINLMGWQRYLSWLIAENIPLSEVYFSYPAPQHAGEYSNLLPGKHIFNAPKMGFSFPKKYLEQKTVQNLATMKNFMSIGPAVLFLMAKTDFSLTSELQYLLRKRIRDKLPAIEEAAEYLNLTKRTLNRRLKEEGTSFKEIKDLIRRDKAINYLIRYPLSIGEIAEKIGFSDPAVFARAFKSWTGQSPSEYRAKHHQNTPSD